MNGLELALAERAWFPADAPPPPRTAWVLADTILVFLKGATAPEVGRLAEQWALAGQTAPLAVPPYTWRSTPERAAALHASAGTFLEMDEGCRPTGHPGIHLVPALLAALSAAPPVTWGTLLQSLVTGYEVVAALARAIPFAREVHPHGHIGAVGVAAAVTRLRGGTPSEAAQAMAVAASLPLRTDWRPCFTGHTVRNAFTGTGALLGLWAASLAEAGFTAEPDALATIFAPALGGPLDTARLLEATPAWAISAGYHKFHAGCSLTHPATEAALTLVAGSGCLTADAVAEVSVEVPERFLRTAAPAADSVLAAQFSTPYTVAAALLWGRSDLGVFSAARRQDPVLRSLLPKIHLQAAADLSRAFPDRAGARLAVRLSDGRRLEAECREPYGGPARPADVDALRNKAERLWPGMGGAWFDTWLAWSRKPQRIAGPDWVAFIDGLAAAGIAPSPQWPPAD